MVLTGWHFNIANPPLGRECMPVFHFWYYPCLANFRCWAVRAGDWRRQDRVPLPRLAIRRLKWRLRARAPGAHLWYCCRLFKISRCRILNTRCCLRKLSGTGLSVWCQLCERVLSRSNGYTRRFWTDSTSATFSRPLPLHQKKTAPV